MSLYKRKDRLLLLAAMILGGINAALSAFISLLLQQIIDAATQKNMDQFSHLFLVMLIYLGCLGLIGFLEAYYARLLLRNVSKYLRERIFKGVINREPASYQSCNTADYLSALINDVKLVEENYLIPLLTCSQMLILFLVTLGVLFYLSPIVTVILLVFLILMFLIPALLGTQMQNRQDAYSNKLSEFTAQSKDFLNGYEVIKGYSIYSYITKHFLSVNTETANKKFSADKLLAVNECFSDMLSSLSIVVIVFVSAWLMLKGNISMGTLLALIQLSGTFVTPVVLLMQNIPKITSMKPVLKRLYELMEEVPKQPETKHLHTPAFHDTLSCSQIRFGYQADQYILNNLNLEIQAGKKYALLGDSGCGKSTLIRLLTGYSCDFEGDICYDGRSVKDMSQTEINSLVSVIHQNVFLFDTDILENICLGDEFSEEELSNALKSSGADQFLLNLDHGIHTKVGENGQNLSGGQRQRIAVARALIRHTPILILDEGTSAVDKETAYEIEQRLLHEKNLTLLTITHHMDQRLQNLYDKIYQMKEGRIL